MSNGALVGILGTLLVLNLIADTIYAWVERRAAIAFAEALDLMVPAFEDIRRIDPHLDESVELAMIRIGELRPKMRRMANGYITPIGLLPRRKGR